VSLIRGILEKFISIFHNFLLILSIISKQKWNSDKRGCVYRSTSDFLACYSLKPNHCFVSKLCLNITACHATTPELLIS